VAYATNFDKYLKRGLADQSTEYIWETGWSEKGQSWKVDVGAGDPKKSSPLVLIEVELKKDNPVENVVKIWRWAREKKKTQRILFLQAFSSHYIKTDKSSRKATKRKQYVRSCFIGERMMEDRRIGLHIDYEELPIYTTTRTGKLIPYTPRMRRGSVIKKGGGAMHRAAENLAKDIAKLLHTKLHR
jgi:hypothetical protein